MSPLRWSALITVAWLLIGASELTQHGIVIDAPSLYYAGDRTYFWLSHRDTELNLLGNAPADFHSQFYTFPDARDPIHYPVLPGLAAAAAADLFSARLGWVNVVDGHNLGLVLLHAVGLFCFCLYACRLLGTVAGVAASVALLFFPSYMGHAFNNPKDLACTDFFACALLAGGAALLRRNLFDTLATGVFLGLSLSCKMNGAFALATWGLWGIGLFLVRLARDRTLDLSIVGAGALVTVVGLAVFFVLWPWLYAGTPGNWQEHLQNYWQWYREYGKSPRDSWTDYAFRCLLSMTPPLILAAALSYLLAGWTGWRTDPERVGIWSLLLLWTGLPLLRISLPHSNYYDANRHFLEHIPGLCCMAGLGVAGFAGWIQRRWGDLRGRSLLRGAAALSLLSLVLPWLMYRPFETSYFNFIVGGLGGAQRSAIFKTPRPHDERVNGTEGDYWYSSVAEGWHQLTRVAPQGATLGTCGPPFAQLGMEWAGEPRLRFDRDDQGADYLYLAPREGFCNWDSIRQYETERPILVRVEKGGGLIYELLGPRVANPLPVVTPLTGYEDPKLMDSSWIWRRI